MESLLDPMQDRQVKSVIPPPAKPLYSELLFPTGDHNAPDWRLLRQHLLREGHLKKEDALKIIQKTTFMLQNEPNLLRVKDPITVVGDIHGQYYDLLKLLDVGGDPHETQYLFLGDYVDRGSFSLEVLFLVFALKLNYPHSIWLLRGNHECRQMTAYFNFRAECEYKYDLSIYDACMTAFDSLPLAAVINGRFLALHGGISPEMKTLSQITQLNRFLEPPRSGLFCDILWADPADEEKGESGRSESFFYNDMRGCSYFFGYKAVCNFLERTGLLSIIRGHEAQLEGYKMNHSSAKTGFPTVITVFSAPNYCDVYNNKGAVLKFQDNTLNIQQFNFSPHPYHLPNFMDIFTWSIPFLSEKVSEILYGLLNTGYAYDDDTIDNMELPTEVHRVIKKNFGSDISEMEQEGSMNAYDEAGLPISSLPLKKRADKLRMKVQSVGRLMRVFKTLREERELVMELKDCTPAHRIPLGLLLEGKAGLVDELDKFNNAKLIDAVNERWPVDDGGRRPSR